MDQFVIL